MEFNQCKDYYHTISEALKGSHQRQELYERSRDFLEALETTLFDRYNVDGIYLIDEFFDKTVFRPNRIPVCWEMEQGKFEEFVDAREAEFLVDSFDVYVDTNKGLFHFNNGFWKSEPHKIIKKELWI